MADAAGVERPASESTQDVIQALRTAQHHQVQLNVPADQKANINIGFTLFFITLTQAQFGLADGEPAVVCAGFMLLILAIASSLLLALLVVLPRMRRQRVRAAEQMSNPFYCGLFTQLEQQEFVDYLVAELDNRGRARTDRGRYLPDRAGLAAQVSPAARELRLPRLRRGARGNSLLLQDCNRLSAAASSNWL